MLKGSQSGQIRPAGITKRKRDSVMKKSLKARLTLNRETLRNLDPDQMAAAAGGSLVPTSQGGDCPVLITSPCLTRSCPTRCGQTYC